MNSSPGGRRTVVVLQPSYVPWRGYFHQIQKADLFVFYDCVQYDKHGWRNRNQIKTQQGLQWLTIPVASGGCVSEGTRICDVEIVSTINWRTKHLRSLQMSYVKAPHFREYSPLLEEIYSREDLKLVDFTCATTEILARRIGISGTEFVRSSTLGATGTKTDRLLDVLVKVGATHYISGPSARDYLDEAQLDRAGISLEYMEYSYPEYPQCFGKFEPRVSILDLLFNVGDETHKYIWG